MDLGAHGARRMPAALRTGCDNSATIPPGPPGDHDRRQAFLRFTGTRTTQTRCAGRLAPGTNVATSIDRPTRARAKRAPSISAERSMRARSSSRRRSSRERSRASSAAMATYWSGWSRRAPATRDCARAEPARPRTVGPTSVITGTPIQNESRLVVCPLTGNVSRHTSMRRTSTDSRDVDWKPMNSTRSGSTPALANALRVRITRLAGGARRTRRDPSTAPRTRAQRAKT